MNTLGAMIRGKFGIDKLTLTSMNPKYDNRNRYGGLGTAGLEPHIKFYTDHGDGTISVPRNYLTWDNAIDERQPGKSVDVTFKGVLRPEQEFLKDFELGVDTILNAYCGFGKSISAAFLISRIKKQTLILCPTTFLCKQWQTELNRFLSTPYMINGIDSIIVKGSGIPFIHKDIVIMTYTLAAKLPPEKLQHFGCVILDESHKIGAISYSPIMEKLPAKYRIALTATWYREDSALKYMRYHFKRIIPIKSSEPPAKLYFVETDFTVNTKFIKGFNDVENEVNNSSIRQQIIHHIISECLKKDRLPILVGKRKSALEKISSNYPHGVLLTSETMKLADTVEKVRNKANVILGISQLIREGADIQKADVLIILTPHGQIEQAIGRIIRKFEGKKQPIILFLYDVIRQYQNTISKALDNIPNAEYVATINWKEVNTIL